MSKRIILPFLFAFFTPFFLCAQYFNTPPLLVPYMESAPETGSRAAVMIDAATGALLYSKNHDEEISPASLTKLMTIHLIMKEIEAGRASYDEYIPITEESWAQRQPPRSSLMNLEPGQIVTLREIMLGLAIPSGNDAAVAAALRFAPSMEEFARLMTIEARSMGLYVTRFVESSGVSEYNMTTAEEFAYFCRKYITMYPNALTDFHSVSEFHFPVAENIPAVFRRNWRTFYYSNRNNLIGTFPGVDGLKTGYIDESGYNIALTAERDQTRYILVTLGAETTRIRDADGRRLLSWAFDNFKTIRPHIGQIESPRLWKGRANSVELRLEHPADFTSPAERADMLIFETWIPEPLIAPVAEGTIAGYLIIYDEYGELNRVPLAVIRNYEKGNIFKRIWHSILLLFKR
ncbi:MAG: D-alanyl-D-alanine carboxypeptidase [Treponema sp.]|jgi:D-alanyl-D-alanine carboxypeptidase (penicillin-binding protein 5/6)|nr:D-alanyl-D-alanine carboxypeptidase [Treponema sp.]